MTVPIYTQRRLYRLKPSFVKQPRSAECGLGAVFMVPGTTLEQAWKCDGGGPWDFRRGRKADGKRSQLTDEVVDECLWERLGMTEPPARAPRHFFLAGRQVHDTHDCWVKGSFSFCGQCGCWSQRIPRLLLEPCDAVAKGVANLTNYQREGLQRIKRGLPPKKLCKDWGPHPDGEIEL